MSSQCRPVSLTVVAIILLCWLVADGFSQARKWQASGIAIHNATDRALVFNLTRSDGRAEAFQLRPGEAQEYDCGFNKISLKTNTDQGPRTVRHNLDCQKRYLLDWNDDRGCWDVFADE